MTGRFPEFALLLMAGVFFNGPAGLSDIAVMLISEGVAPCWPEAAVQTINAILMASIFLIKDFIFFIFR